MAVSPIQLPQWYAGFSSSVLHDLRNAAVDTVRVGPLTVCQAPQGVEIARFGAPADPGVVLFDGYLFERRSLRRELALDPCASDAAIAVAAYQQWSENVFDRLDGSYLLAVWDPRHGRLLLGHDALGHHPVFYSAQPQALWFGSNVLALAESGRVSNSPNRVSLVLAGLTHWPAAGQTFFESIHRLRPGRYLAIARDQTVHSHDYFSPWLADDEPELTESQVNERFEPTLIGAVTRSMELEPGGIMLSGGLDSVTIAALAAEYATTHGTPMIAAVSGRRDDTFTGEEPAQTATATALGMRHLVAKESEWMGARGEVEMSFDVISELPAPSRIYWVGAVMGFYRLTAAQHVNVLLTGSGGDNWASVGDAYAADSMRRLDLRQLMRFIYSYMDTGGLSFSAAARHFLWAGGLRVLLDSFTARWLPTAKARYHYRRARTQLPAWLCPDPGLKDAVADTLLGERLPPLTKKGRAPRSYYRHAQRSVVNPYYQYEFEIGFHLETACGLRLLSPYHDRQLVRFLNAVPPGVHLKSARYKGLLRPVAERRLPGLGMKDQRKDYEPAVRSAHRNSLSQGVSAAWPGHRFDQLVTLGVVDGQALRGAFSDPVSSQFVQMYALMSAERWVDAHARP